jgi:hypothetical protein
VKPAQLITHVNSKQRDKKASWLPSTAYTYYAFRNATLVAA